jgi:hypothetical protein
VDPLHYQCNDAAKLKLAAAFLGTKKGLAIVPPTIPRVLCQSDPNLSHLTDLQRAWIAELRTLADENFDNLLSPVVSEEVKKNICDKVWVHLDHLTSTTGANATRLFAMSSLVADWCELLGRGSKIVRSTFPRPGSATDGNDNADSGPPGPSYEVNFQLTSPEVALVIACTVISYSFLRHVSKELTSTVYNLLADQSTQYSSTDSSDDEDSWQRQRSRKSRRARKYGDRPKELSRGLTNILTSAAMIQHSVTYNRMTQLPVVALATTVRLRPIVTPYIACKIDNWQSLGCDIDDLANDAIFQDIKQLRPEFAYPTARWTVLPRIGNAVVGLWIREEYKNSIADLNDIIRSLLKRPQAAQAALRIVHSVGLKDKHGRIIRSSVISVELTPTTRVAPPVQHQRAAQPSSLSASTATASSSAPGSYAMRLAEGVRRSNEASARNCCGAVTWREHNISYPISSR